MARWFYFLLAAGTFLTRADPFDVASIRVNRSDSNAIGGTGICGSGGKVSIRNMPFTMIVEQAFDVKAFQIADAPGWFGTERFDIEARPAIRAGRAECLQMMQALLAERFQLKTRRAVRRLPVLHLVTQPGGPKMQRLADSAATGVTTYRGGVFDTGTFGISMKRFAAVLSGFPELEKSVVDQTGLDGIYRVRLEWAPEHANGAQGGMSLFAAMPEQLGLRLKAGRGPVDIVVIERCNRTPAEN